MTAEDALFGDPLPEGFARRVFHVAPGHELGLERDGLLDAIVVIEQGELEVECRAGARRRFARGSMICVARLPLARLRSVGTCPLVLVAVSRASRPGPMSLRATPDRTATAEYDFGGR